MNAGNQRAQVGGLNVVVRQISGHDICRECDVVTGRHRSVFVHYASPVLMRSTWIFSNDPQAVEVSAVQISVVKLKFV